jgi:holliday junction DNA helicase RuvA
MISRITGVVVEQSEKSVVLETGGIGYCIYTPTYIPLGATATLHTHMVVRDDCHELFGFERPEEKSLFQILIGVSGVGPKTGLHMLTLYPLNELVRIIKTGDSKAIALVPGIGKKTAEKVVIDLKDKLDAFDTATDRADRDLVEALLSLGYKDIQIRTIIGSVDAGLPIERQIMTALQLLQK